MANLYDICNLVFENDTGRIEHNYDVEIRDFDDYIEIKTALVIEGINRGWIGNIIFNFSGYDIKTYDNNRTVHEQLTLKNVLCRKRVFDKNNKDIVEWTYEFLKY